MMKSTDRPFQAGAREVSLPAHAVRSLIIARKKIVG
jgi:hypothetical protein